jgi:hypothetical protein
MSENTESGTGIRTKPSGNGSVISAERFGGEEGRERAFEATRPGNSTVKIPEEPPE